MSLTNVAAVAKRLAILGFPDWTAIQESYKGADGHIEYGDVGVECAARERLFRVSYRMRDYFPVRRRLKDVAKDLTKALKMAALNEAQTEHA
jgi:hypothetical protein